MKIESQVDDVDEDGYNSMKKRGIKNGLHSHDLLAGHYENAGSIIFLLDQVVYIHTSQLRLVEQ